MNARTKNCVLPKNTISKTRRHVSELIVTWCKTHTLKSFEELAEVSHSFAIYLRDKGNLEVGRAGDVAEALRTNGEPKLADDFILAYLRDHVPSGSESRVEIALRREKARPVKDAKARALLAWLETEIERDPEVFDVVSAAYKLAHRPSR